MESALYVRLAVMVTARKHIFILVLCVVNWLEDNERLKRVRVYLYSNNIHARAPGSSHYLYGIRVRARVRVPVVCTNMIKYNLLHSTTIVWHDVVL